MRARSCCLVVACMMTILPKSKWVQPLPFAPTWSTRRPRVKPRCMASLYRRCAASVASLGCVMRSCSTSTEMDMRPRASAFSWLSDCARVQRLRRVHARRIAQACMCMHAEACACSAHAGAGVRGGRDRRNMHLCIQAHV